MKIKVKNDVPSVRNTDEVLIKKGSILDVMYETSEGYFVYCDETSAHPMTELSSVWFISKDNCDIIPEEKVRR